MNLPVDAKIPLSHNVALSEHTTMKVGGPAAFLGKPSSEEELVGLLEFARHERLPVVIMGKGSNVIFPDEGYPGLVIMMTQYEKNKILVDEEKNWVCVSSGWLLYPFVLACRDKGLSGAEFLATIPGTVGGALTMNAGFSRFPGQRSQIGDLVTEVTVMSEDGKKERLHKDQLHFSYRKSNLTAGVILEACLQLWRRDPAQIEEEIRRCFLHRKKTQNVKFPSAGSFFKNPSAPAEPAARMIQELGLKGTRFGDIMISEEHANYFVNVGKGTSGDVIRLMQFVQEKIFHAKGIWLEPEVRIIPKP